MRRAWTRIAVTCLLLSATTLALAAEGRTPVWVPGTVIAAPGRYILTRNLVGGGAVPTVDIAAPNVDLDLNGFTIDSVGGVAGIRISAPSEVRVHDGEIRNASAGVEVLAGGSRVVLEDLRIESTLAVGIRILDVASFAIRRAVINNSGGDAIRVEGPAPKEGSIEDSQIRRAPGFGILVDTANGVTIRNNNLDEFSSEGVVLSKCHGCLVIENTVTRASGSGGILVLNSFGDKLVNNTVSECRTNGIRVDPGSGDALVLDNVVRRNGFPVGPGHGLLVEGDRVMVQGNVLTDNNGFGLRLTATSSLCTFGRNTARGNSGFGGGACAAAPPLFPPNSCNDGAVNSTFGDNLIPGPPVF